MREDNLANGGAAPGRSDAQYLKTAIHEAGHAVSHVRFGIFQSRVTIEPAGGSAGHTLAMDAESCWSKEDAESMTLAYCAGYAALIAAGYPDDEAEEGCGDDFDEALGLVEFWGLGDLAACKARAAEFMRLPDNVRAVRVVADELMRCRSIDGESVDLLVDLADGEVTAAEFERYRIIRAHLMAQD